jgi:hypothetical protein
MRCPGIRARWWIGGKGKAISFLWRTNNVIQRLYQLDAMERLALDQQ